MTDYVLTLAVGPVQGFIASARRSRDLWAGSWLLSELAKAAAGNLYHNGAELIFPFVQNPNDLKPESEFSVGNKIQAVIKNASKDEVIHIANQAKTAADRHFQKVANQVKNKLEKYNLRNEIWQEQLGDYVEAQYAWAAISDGDYLSAVQKAAALLAARKATRDFAPLAVTADAVGHRIPKSSLDGARETVLPEYDFLPTGLRKKLGLNQSEQLDCAGVVKRLCGHPEQFTPITRVAAHDWIGKICLHQNFERVKACYEKLVQNNLATRVSGNKGVYAKFPYDAQFLYSSRLNAARAKSDAEDLILLNQLQDALKPIWREYGEPCPYFAMLLADGDKMGELLDKAKEKQHHKDITKSLSAFAQKVPDIMRQNHAQCVYSGGDDVLGMATLSDVLKCAENLKNEFSGSLNGISEALGAETPTLSVGVAICHVTTPLGMIRRLAKRAEKIAKGDAAEQPRNALGITLAIRSGAMIDMRLRWDDSEALNYFKQWIDVYAKGGLSSRVAYDCRDIFMRTDFRQPDLDLQNKIRFAELTRMLAQARDANGRELSPLVQQDLLKRYEKLNHLNKLANELIIARWLAVKTQRDLGRDN